MAFNELAAPTHVHSFMQEVSGSIRGAGKLDSADFHPSGGGVDTNEEHLVCSWGEGYRRMRS